MPFLPSDMTAYILDGSAGKESTCNAGDTGLIPGSGRSPGEEYGNPLQYSCLGNPMATGAWHATVQRATESWTQHSGEERENLS